MTTVAKIRDNFKNKKLLDQAFTHRSWINENPQVRGTNERLEFLGDAILEFVVSDFIYRKFQDKEEGFLTALRSNIVNTTNLAKLANKLNLGEKLFLSKGEENGGGRTNPALLADTTEAVIGAIYIDQGLEAASEFITKNLLNDIEDMLAKPLKDPKSRLQEAVQSKGYPAPKYKVKSEIGPDHQKQFTVEVLSNGNSLGEGSGSSKLKAEQVAAEAALEKLE